MATLIRLLSSRCLSVASKNSRQLPPPTLSVASSSASSRSFLRASPNAFAPAVRYQSTTSDNAKVKAPPMVYIQGEEMTHYATQLLLQQWIEPHFDTSAWETYDLSCKSRDDTNDQVLKDAVDAGKRIGAIFKEPTITPSAIQVQEMGLKKAWGSPNGAMRKGWNGITISRDTIHIEGIEMGYKQQVLFERHAVGGEYGAGWNEVGQGTLLTTYIPDDGSAPFVVDKRDLTDNNNVCVVYHNPYDNVRELAHIFYKRCLEHKVTPYIVTKKTVFKWQEGFWRTMKQVFDDQYKDEFLKAGLLDRCGGNLTHLISDAATMQLIRWTDGGFGMAAHNYDGDMLTDQIAQVHRSPGFITSNLVGKSDDGTLIKEFEASHGTVTDLWNDHLAGRETSLNPLGLVEALMGAMSHAANLQAEKKPNDRSTKEMKAYVDNFVETLRTSIHNTFRYGQGTRDMCGPTGFTTEDFIAKVAWRLNRYLEAQHMRDIEKEKAPQLSESDLEVPQHKMLEYDQKAILKLFSKYDKSGDGKIDFKEFSAMLVKMGVAPKKQ
jgi:isocitrate dehydrogenase